MCKKTSLEWTLLGSQFDYWTKYTYIELHEADYMTVDTERQ